MLVNLTSGVENLHSASMGLGLARSALDGGHPVVVFLNVGGAAFADRGLGGDVRFEDFPPIAVLLGDILTKGGQVFVCRHCAGVMKVPPENIRPGIVPVDHHALFGALRPGMVAFTY